MQGTTKPTKLSMILMDPIQSSMKNGQWIERAQPQSIESNSNILS